MKDNLCRVQWGPPMSKRLLLVSALALALCGTAQAADLQLYNGDAAGVGLNDPTPAAPVGGNTATTIGGQRIRVYEYAMKLWGNVLGSNAPVLIHASFPALACDAGSAVLGSAGAWWVASDSTTYYHGALANALTNSDLNPAAPEIQARFNPNLGAANCLAGSGWYYGLDGNTPAGKINFLNVVMHEIGHGLGASSFINKTSGAFLDLDGAGTLYTAMPDVYALRARDNITGKAFADPTETSAQRATAMKTVGATVWTGANVNQQAALLLDSGYQETSLHVSAPAPLARDYGFYTSGGNFGPIPAPANFNGQWVLATDALEAPAPGTTPTTTDGCSPITNAAAIAGKVAMIDRGNCGFVVKVKNAQNAGATAVVILNSAATWGTMGGTDPTITIPAVLVQQGDGAAFKANAPITGGMVLGPVTLAGMDVNGRTRLYSPWVVATGSTFSHFDTVLHPDALMEPFDSPEVQAQVSLDLTPALMRDIGWPMNEGTTKMFGGMCDTGVPATGDGGFVTGANIAATDAMCKIGNTRLGYYNCMKAYADKLYADGLINKVQKGTITICARRTMDNWGH